MSEKLSAVVTQSDYGGVCRVNPAVAVVITTYNHAHFLGEAIESALAQTHTAAQVIVVDDGSTDDPAGVTAGYPAVQLICQENQGLAAARNTGLRAAEAEYVLFLDADDRLFPGAVAAGLACFAASPGCAFVYGAHRRVDKAGAPLGGVRYSPAGADGYAGLLGGNLVAMHATVLYRRDALSAAGGYDADLRRCEDYDLYLRLARDGRIASHPELVAEYRWHDSNMSHDRRAMLGTVLAVHSRHHDAAAARPETRAAWHAGRRNWLSYYAEEALMTARADPSLSRAQALAAAARLSPRWVFGRLARAGWRRTRARLPWQLARALPGGHLPPPVGQVDFGDFGDPIPVSLDFGFDRGLPIDRYYVEGFLTRHTADIHGRVMEIGDDEYSRRFGAARISHQDILHVHAGNPRATIIGDLSVPGVLPEAAFDCIVFTQTLHLIYDMPGAVACLWAALKPGGVLLLTVPGISQIDRGEWGDNWFWSLTPASLRRIMGERFSDDQVMIGAHGNVLAATAYLQGLACTEVSAAKLDVHDKAYPMIVTARAVRAQP